MDQWSNTFVLTFPDFFSISPRKALRREDFPDPTAPTIATNEFSFTLRLILCSTSSPLFPQEKIPFSITIGSTENNNNFSKVLNIKYYTNVKIECICLHTFRVIVCH